MLDLKKTEKEIESYWEKEKIYETLLKRKGKNYFVLDGPPYANFIPHVGHIKNTVFKDLVIRMKFMQGYNVLFQPGFDTRGLPVENMVEKKLNLTNKKDIEKFGIENFMNECKNNAALNKDLWMEVYKKLGSVYQFKEPYLTYEDYYISSAWWGFSQMHKKKLIYEGEKPVMWCPHCETSLSGYETTDSYKEVSDPGVYVLFKLKDKNEHLLVYTTTPWTLPANVGVAVAPKENYVKVDIMGKIVILAEKRLNKLSELEIGYNILKTIKGESLVGLKYESLLDVPLQKRLLTKELGKSHEVIASIPILKERVASKVRTKKNVFGQDLFEEFVTMTDGSGLVHCAPGHGKSDYIVGQHYGLAVVSPVDNACNLTEESGFSGFVKKADKEIIARLENEGKLLHMETIKHNYPLCWRCKSPLIFRLSKQFFLKTNEVKKIIQKTNKKVNWMPSFARERFDNWVENAEDWNISRQRYWGIPIPLWQCSCGKEKVIEGKHELENLSKQKIKDLHYAEQIEFSCVCGKNMKKVKGVLDVWFDSGISPFASMGYPYMNKELFENNFPVDRINEAQDQIRGWFYSLMYCSSAIFGKAPYKSVSMTGWVLDKNGNKMSKSQGNTVTGEEALNNLGADLLRYYFCWDVAPYEIQKFNVDIAKKEIGKILNVLINLPNLADRGKIELENIEDKWILSRLNSLIKNYTESLESFELHRALRLMSDFILNDLSRSYIQITREREPKEIIAKCLEVILKLLAPVCPFLSEELWLNLLNKKIVKENSVHLSSWPKQEAKMIDLKLEEEFREIIKIIEIGLSQRDKAKIGLRWPLAKAKVSANIEIDKDYKEIIERQLNVKKILSKKIKTNEIEVELDTEITKELEEEGYAREIARKIQAERKIKNLKKGEIISLNLFTDEETKKIIELHETFIKNRTNSEKINFVDEENLKEAIVFTVKEKKISMIFS